MANVASADWRIEETANRYDRWFEENPQTYRAELEAVRSLLPVEGRGLEIGVGTGRFAGALGVRTGVDPSRAMLIQAAARSVEGIQARGEHLPFRSGCFDFALLVAVLCFVPDPVALLKEARRVLKDRGRAIVAFIDRGSGLGKLYESKRASSHFCSSARYHSPPEMLRFARAAGFARPEFCQTLLEGGPPESAYRVLGGFGAGGFVVLSAVKRML